MSEVHSPSEEKAMQEARSVMARIMDDSCAHGRSKGFKVRWEWRGNSVWLIDETEQPPTETEMADVVPLSEAMADIET